MEAGGAFERAKDPAVARGENKETSRLPPVPRFPAPGFLKWCGGHIPRSRSRDSAGPGGENRFRVRRGPNRINLPDGSDQFIAFGV